MYFKSLYDSTSQQQTNIFWSLEELQTMEIFFNETFFPLSPSSNLAMPSIDVLSLQGSQNLNTAMGSFERMLSIIHPRIFKDLVKIIRLEQVFTNFIINRCDIAKIYNYFSFHKQNPESHHLWQARWRLTIPQSNGFSQAGHPGIYYMARQSSFLFMVLFISLFLIKYHLY